MAKSAFNAIKVRPGRESHGPLATRRMNPTTDCAPKGPVRSWALWGPPMSRKDLTHFTRQLATLTKAGVPLVRALDTLARPEKRAARKAIILRLAEVIRTGGNFSDGVQENPQVFDRLYASMMRSGEAGGVLSAVLSRTAQFLERTERIKARMKAAMTYPIIVTVLAGGILAGLMIFVVPKFEQVFSGILKGQPLPWLTRMVIGIGNLFGHHYLATIGLAVISWLGWRMFLKSRVGTRFVQRWLIRAPVLGELLLKSAIARFSRTFGSLLASGVPILEALTITRDTSGNVHLGEALEAVRDQVKAGDRVAPSLEATGLFPDMVTSMVEIGEETGDLAGMLGRIADTYDEEVDNAVAALTSVVEPMMIVSMALVVGTIVIALFLPIVGIVQHLQ